MARRPHEDVDARAKRAAKKAPRLTADQQAELRRLLLQFDGEEEEPRARAPRPRRRK